MSALEIVCIFYLKHAFILRFPANRSDNFMKQSQIVEFRYEGLKFCYLKLVEYGRQQMDNFYIVSTSAYITPEPSDAATTNESNCREYLSGEKEKKNGSTAKG
ncbi:hypothetical protein CsSME_00041806 [Camellia sinensis var. sinensis]